VSWSQTKDNNNYFKDYYMQLSYHLSKSPHLIVEGVNQLMSVCGSTDGTVDVPLHRVLEKNKVAGLRAA
jgi:hypothetical protein